MYGDGRGAALSFDGAPSSRLATADFGAATIDGGVRTVLADRPEVNRSVVRAQSSFPERPTKQKGSTL